MADEIITQDPSAEATPSESQNPSPAPDSSNEGVQVNQESTPDTGEGNVDGENNLDQKTVVEEDVDYAAKYKESSTEAKRLVQERNDAIAEAKNAREDLLKTVSKDRGTFEAWIDERPGVTPEQKAEYMQMYDTQIAPSATPATEGDKGEPSQPVAQPPINPVRESWMREKDAEAQAKIDAQKTATEEFFSREENTDMSGFTRNSILVTAQMLDLEHGYEPKDALETARKRVLEPELLKEEGYIEGVQDSLQGGVSRGVQGGSSGQTDTIQLPAKDDMFIKMDIERKGLTGDDAIRYRKLYADKVKSQR